MTLNGKDELRERQMVFVGRGIEVIDRDRLIIHNQREDRLAENKIFKVIYILLFCLETGWLKIKDLK